MVRYSNLFPLFFIFFCISATTPSSFIVTVYSSVSPTIGISTCSARLDENLLRYLTIKVDALEEGPSAMLETKGRRAKAEDKYEIEITEGE